MSTPALVGCIPPAQCRPGPLLLTPELIQLSRPRSPIEAAGWSLLFLSPSLHMQTSEGTSHLSVSKTRRPVTQG